MVQPTRRATDFSRVPLGDIQRDMSFPRVEYDNGFRWDTVRFFGVSMDKNPLDPNCRILSIGTAV